MRHITDEQLEDILQGREHLPEHMTVCAWCNERLSGKAALARRLRRAFDSIKPSDELAPRIRSRLTLEANEASCHPARSLGWIHLRRLIRSGLAVAAVVAVVALVRIDGVGPRSASAAQELAKIHNHNLETDHDFYDETDPDQLAQYFEARLGFVPLMPGRHEEVQLKGCCVRRFQGEAVGTYVAETSVGAISIVAAKQRPRSLEMFRHTEHEGRRYGHCSFSECNVVVVRAGDYWYYAVGQVSHDHLMGLLSRLLG